MHHLCWYRCGFRATLGISRGQGGSWHSCHLSEIIQIISSGKKWRLPASGCSSSVAAGFSELSPPCFINVTAGSSSLQAQGFFFKVCQVCQTFNESGAVQRSALHRGMFLPGQSDRRHVALRTLGGPFLHCPACNKWVQPAKKLLSFPAEIVHHLSSSQNCSR